MNSTEELDRQRVSLVNLALKANGPLLHGDELWSLLGYASAGAMRNALYRETLPITLMEFPYRQGKFALTEEVFNWLFDQRCKNTPELPFNAELTGVLSSAELNEYLQKYGLLLHEKTIMSVLGINERKDLMNLHKKKSVPFALFQIDNRRLDLFALLPEVILYLKSRT